MTTPEKTPVLIVGGGIVGLSTSLFLAKLGIKPLLIERHPSTCIHPRARAVNARTMEINRAYGLLDAIKKGGENLKDAAGIYEATTMVEVSKRRPKLYYGGIVLSILIGLLLLSYWLLGLFGIKCLLFLILCLCTVVGVLAYRQMSSLSASITFCTQDILEPILLNKATQLGVEARFNSELIDVEQTDSEVTATILDRTTGKKSVVLCQYLIAADGARSPLRTRLNIPFEGPPPFSRQLNLLFKADLTSLTKNGCFSLCQINQPDLRGLLVAINATDIWTLHVAVPKDANPEDFPKEKCINWIRAAVGIPDLEPELKGVMTWDAQVKVTRDYQQGRIFFAGDAAHAMPPWGGFGANTGVQDAHNLAWKIAAVVKREAGPKLLETYHQERHPVAVSVTQISGSMSHPDGLMKTSWFELAPNLIKASPYYRVGYGYGSSAVILEPGPIPGPLTNDLEGRPGTRVPHVQIKINNTTIPISTMDLCVSGLTLFCGPKLQTLHHHVKQAAEILKIQIQIFQMGIDFHENITSSFNINENGALLVRPDSFVAWRIVSETNHSKEEALTVLTKLYSRE